MHKNTPLYHYRAYGLELESEIALPGLLTGGDKADLSISRAELQLPRPELYQATRWVGASNGGLMLHWAGVATLRVTGGQTIQVTPDSAVSPQLLLQVISGPALAVALHQLGAMVFHAAVVRVQEGAVAFLARKGYGKSTLAAALVAKGFPLVSDDLLVLERANGGFVARSGIPRLKLWPDAVSACGWETDGFPTVSQVIEKRVLTPIQPFESAACPLQAVYVLEKGGTISIQALKAQEALRAVAPHWYGTLFQGDLLPFFGLAEHLRQCTILARRVPVFRLQRPPDLSLLAETASAVARHAAAAVAVKQIF